MTDRSSPASVRQRLLNRAKAEGVEFEYMLVRYANERLLYRLSVSAFRDAYVLKGATLFAIWSDAPHRPTRDIDLLGYGDLAPERVAREFATLCGQPADPDGVTFDAETVRAEMIREGQTYEGVRVTLRAALDGADIALQVDVGFGDATAPGLTEQELPALLEYPAARLRAYRPETVIAEKFEAMVKLGIANTRMKDFYDIYVLSKTMTFRLPELARALHATFERRRTSLPASPPFALSDEFANDTGKRQQWRAFTDRLGGEPAGLALADVVREIRTFIMPAVALARELGTLRDASAP